MKQRQPGDAAPSIAKSMWGINALIDQELALRAADGPITEATIAAVSEAVLRRAWRFLLRNPKAGRELFRQGLAELISEYLREEHGDDDHTA